MGWYGWGGIGHKVTGLDEEEDLGSNLLHNFFVKLKNVPVRSFFFFFRLGFQDLIGLKSHVSEHVILFQSG